MELKMWLARNKSNILWLFIGEKPKKEKNGWSNVSNHCQIMYSNLFPEVQWSDDEPTKVKLVIDK